VASDLGVLFGAPGSQVLDGGEQGGAEAAVKHAPEGVKVTLYEGLAELPFYNEDIDTDEQRPAAATRLRETAARADAFLLVTPEHNGTMPAVLKNAIDWLSRPFGSSALAGSPTAVIGTAFGQYGGVWAQDDARKSARIAGATVLEDAKLAIPGSVTRFAETHPADDTEAVAQLRQVLSALAATIEVPAS
jgi:NAD(P)H-dependent FMN reductase